LSLSAQQGSLFDFQFAWFVASQMFQNAVTTLKWMWFNVLRGRMPEVWLNSVLPTLLAAVIFYALARIAFAKLPVLRRSRMRWIAALALIGSLSGLLTWCLVQAPILKYVPRTPDFFYGHFFIDLPPLGEFLLLTAVTGALLGAAIGWLSGRGESGPRPADAKA
jgi:hypothetical protein